MSGHAAMETDARIQEKGSRNNLNVWAGFIVSRINTIPALDSTGSFDDRHALIAEYDYFIPLEREYESQIRVW